MYCFSGPFAFSFMSVHVQLCGYWQCHMSFGFKWSFQFVNIVHHWKICSCQSSVVEDSILLECGMVLIAK
jgi:hypothetical protein